MTAPHPEAALSAREVLTEARAWVEHSFAQLRPLSPAACEPGEALLRKIDTVLSLSTAHTATAGDGWVREAATRLLNACISDFGLGDDDDDDSAVGGGATPADDMAITFGHLRGLQAALAQAPAVQAPAGEALREATEILISALDECGEIFGTIRDDYTDPRRQCREGRELAAEALKAARALVAASPTPTDAQPKAARPVGAGDGGERAEEQIDLATLTLALDAWGERWVENEADNLLAVCRSFAAQAPAVQAPAGEGLREATEILMAALDECGEIFGTIRDDYTDPRRECREGRERAAEALKAARALLAASPTPTDAQPKAARPVGDEALREASEKAWLAYRYGSEECRGAGWTNSSASSAWDAAWEARGALPSHPTTGQETVATPRNGGVREALAVLDRLEDEAIAGGGRSRVSVPLLSWSEVDDLLAALSAPGSAGQETRAAPRDDGVREALANEIAEIVAGLDPASGFPARHAHELSEIVERNADVIIAALSAPGSAGPGETAYWPGISIPVDAAQPMSDALLRIYRRIATGTLGAFMAPGDVAHLIAEIDRLRATPSPAQEPGTGDTGEAGRPIEEAPRDGTPIIAWGAPSSRYPDEREWRETRWTLYGEGSPAYAAHKAGKGPEGYWDWSEPHSDWGASWEPTRFIPLPTPATTAETPGPAMEGGR